MHAIWSHYISSRPAVHVNWVTDRASIASAHPVSFTSARDIASHRLNQASLSALRYQLKNASVIASPSARNFARSTSAQICMVSYIGESQRSSAHRSRTSRLESVSASQSASAFSIMVGLSALTNSFSIWNQYRSKESVSAHGYYRFNQYQAAITYNIICIISIGYFESEYLNITYGDAGVSEILVKTQTTIWYP